MSTNLYFRIIKKGKPLGDNLKFILRKYRQSLYRYDLNSDDISFLQGVALSSHNATTKKDVEKLIELIEEYGEVEVYEE